MKVLKEEFLQELCDLGLGEKWHSLGVHLKAPSSILKVIKEGRYVCPSKCIEKMLRDWFNQWRKHEQETAIQKLTTALEKICRQDLSEELRLNSNAHSHREVIILHLSQRIICHWEQLGTFLGIDMDMIDSYKRILNTAAFDNRDPAVQLLLSWNKSYSGVDPIKDLTAALKVIGRRDVIDFIDEKMQTPSEVYVTIECGTTLDSLSDDVNRQCIISADNNAVLPGYDEIDNDSRVQESARSTEESATDEPAREVQPVRRTLLEKPISKGMEPEVVRETKVALNAGLAVVSEAPVPQVKHRFIDSSNLRPSMPTETATQ